VTNHRRKLPRHHGICVTSWLGGVVVVMVPTCGQQEAVSNPSHLAKTRGKMFTQVPLSTNSNGYSQWTAMFSSWGDNWQKVVEAYPLLMTSVTCSWWTDWDRLQTPMLLSNMILCTCESGSLLTMINVSYHLLATSKKW